MTRHELTALLAERPIVHPTRIDGVTWQRRQLVVEIRGYRWWASAYEDRQAEATASLVFNDVGDGRLRTDEFSPDDDEALDAFEVVAVADVPWAQGSDWSVYCSGPIGDPAALYVSVQDYLHRHGAFLGPEDFLHQAEELSSFTAMAQASGFLVARGPACIRDLVCSELERQSVPHNVLDTIFDTEPRLLVRLGNSAFFCQEALIELPD